MNSNLTYTERYIRELEIEKERLKLKITQLECKINLLETKNTNEIEKYEELIRLKDNYNKTMDSILSNKFYEISKRIDNLCFLLGDTDKGE